jgi:hypothetical protein
VDPSNQEKNSEPQGKSLDYWGKRGKEVAGLAYIVVNLCLPVDLQYNSIPVHSELRKAESSVLIQLRTGRIGLAYFLHKAKVLGFDTGQCRCGQGAETPRHLLLHCPEEGTTVVAWAYGPADLCTTT